MAARKCAVRLIDFLTTGKQIRNIQKAEIPSLLGEIEALNAKLWVRLTEWEGLERASVSDKIESRKRQIEEQEMPQKKPVGPEGRILRMKDVLWLVGVSIGQCSSKTK